MMSTLCDSLRDCHLVFLGQKRSNSHFSINRFNFICIINEIIGSDLIVIGPGTLFQVITSWYHNLYYVMIILISKILKKKIITFGLGSEPLPFLLKRIIIASLPKKTPQYVRDTYTLNLLTKFKKEKSNKFISSLPDITMLSQIQPLDKTNPNQLALCVSPNKVSNKVFESLKKIKERFHIDVLLYTQDQEERLCKKLANTLNITNVRHISYWHQQKHPKVLPGIFLTTRYHVAIWAALKGSLFICHNQQEKCNQLAQQFRAPSLNWENSSELVRTILSLQENFSKTQAYFKRHIQLQKEQLSSKIPTLFT